MPKMQKRALQALFHKIHHVLHKETLRSTADQLNSIPPLMSKFAPVTKADWSLARK